ncbi:hypothetical protein [Citrobacter werkmanii]|uniref:hypothetical protein n=1 Tax=Citrobacter werkmanii TaxID=67827 RepID=UPI003F8D7929
MSSNQVNAKKFLSSLKHLSTELVKLRNNDTIDKIKNLFIAYTDSLEESNELNDLISKLIELSERNIDDNDIDHFICLISKYWIMILMKNIHIEFFGNLSNAYKLSNTIHNFSEVQHVPADQDIDTSSITALIPQSVFTLVIYDDIGSKILSQRKNLNVFDYIYLDDIFIDTIGRTTKDKINYLINRHNLLRKKHYILLPIYSIITSIHH